MDQIITNNNSLQLTSYESSDVCVG